MLPFIFEWHWDAGRMIFMGLLYMALGIIGIGMLIALGKTCLDMTRGGGEEHGGHH